MSVDLNLLEQLSNINEKTPLKFTLHLGESKYLLENVTIINSPTPVNSPTTRGGVYFSDKFAYKINGLVRDLSVIPLLSKTMLGPNTDFHDILISTQDSTSRNYSIYANLTNSVQSPTDIELSMIIVRLESD